MYKMAVQSYDHRISELLVENSDLRDSLRDLQHELQQLMNLHQETSRQIARDEHEKSLRMDRVCEEQFGMPFDLVREEVEEKMLSQMGELRARMEVVMTSGEISRCVVSI